MGDTKRPIPIRTEQEAVAPEAFPNPSEVRAPHLNATSSISAWGWIVVFAKMPVGMPLKRLSVSNVLKLWVVIPGLATSR